MSGQRLLKMMTPCAFSRIIPSTIFYIGMLDTPSPPISSLMKKRSFPRTVTRICESISQR